MGPQTKTTYTYPINLREWSSWQVFPINYQKLTNTQIDKPKKKIFLFVKEHWIITNYLLSRTQIWKHILFLVRYAFSFPIPFHLTTNQYEIKQQGVQWTESKTKLMFRKHSNIWFVVWKWKSWLCCKNKIRWV